MAAADSRGRRGASLPGHGQRGARDRGRTARGAHPTLAAEFAPRRLAELEAHWSRFVPTSDLCRLAAAEGRLVRRPSRHRHPRRGHAGGRHRHRRPLRPDPRRATSSPPVTSRTARPAPIGDVSRGLRSDHGSIHDVEIDRDAGRMRTPAGLVLDPGGIGKGLAADLVAAELCAAGATGALVGIGGDLAARGRHPTTRDG